MTSTPHDALFKAIFKRPEHARAELESVVPASLAQALDWRTIRHLPGSFVDPKLAEHHTDLLFSVKVREGGEALLYLLEHQSTSHRHMALRLLGYLVRIWETWCEQQEDPTSRLPVIVPVVFYHGERRWAAPVSFDALVEVPESMVEEVRPYVPSFRYVVDDLSDVGDEALRRRALTGLGLLVTVCLRDVRARDAVEAMKPWVAEWADLLRAGAGPHDLLYVFRYIYEVKGVEEAEGFGEFLAREVGPEGRELMMTAAEQLRSEGRTEGERELILKLLRQRFGELDAKTEQRIARAESWELEQWTTRVLTAATLDEVLAVP